MVHTPKIDMSTIDSARLKAQATAQAERAKAQAAEAAVLLAGAGSKAAHGAKDAAFHARYWAEPRVDSFLEWLRPRAEKAWHESVSAAAPRVEQTAGRVTPVIDTAHDKIVDEYLPRLVAAFNTAATRAGSAAAAAAAAAEAAEKAAAKGQRRAKRRRGFLWLLLGGLATAVGYTFWRRAQPQNDPWAEPWEQATAPDYDGVARDARHAAGDAAEAVGEAAGVALARGRDVREQAAEKVAEAVDRAKETARKAQTRRSSGVKNAEQAPGESVGEGAEPSTSQTDAVVDAAEETKSDDALRGTADPGDVTPGDTKPGGSSSQL